VWKGMIDRHHPIIRGGTTNPALLGELQALHRLQTSVEGAGCGSSRSTSRWPKGRHRGDAGPLLATVPSASSKISDPGLQPREFGIATISGPALQLSLSTGMDRLDTTNWALLPC